MNIQFYSLLEIELNMNGFSFSFRQVKKSLSGHNFCVERFLFILSSCNLSLMDVNDFVVRKFTWLKRSSRSDPLKGYQSSIYGTIQPWNVSKDYLHIGAERKNKIIFDRKL